MNLLQHYTSNFVKLIEIMVTVISADTPKSKISLIVFGKLGLHFEVNILTTYYGV